MASGDVIVTHTPALNTTTCKEAVMSASNSTTAPAIEHLRSTLKIGQSGYRRGCRCVGCCEAARDAAAKYKSRPGVKERIRERNQSPEGIKKRRERDANPEVRKRIRAYRNRYEQRHDRKAIIARRVAEISAIKVGRGCADCGYKSHPVALDFDHVRGVKRCKVSNMWWGHRWDRVLEEIEKCEVVCANCHRIRTYNRKRETKK
jgi:hypothetical protein